MKFGEILLRIIAKTPFTRLIAQKVMNMLILKSWSRRKINAVYSTLSIGSKRAFHLLFAKIFRNTNVDIIDGLWQVRFNDQPIKIPLSKSSLWLDWDIGLSVIGHDIEIKSFYEKLLNSHFRPKCFYDIGANYGTHSLLLMANKVETISFEPNVNCNPFFRKILHYNGLEPNIENIALSSQVGKSHLIFPQKDTWLGRYSEDNQDYFKNYKDVQRICTQLTTLDAYCAEKELKPDLIKIDTEGHEINVLLGGKETIESIKPIIIFECNEQRLRTELKNQFDLLDYYIYDFSKLYNPLTNHDFIQSKSTNYLALHKDHNLNKKEVMSIFLTP